MKTGWNSLLAAAFLAACTAAPLGADVALVRDFTYDPARVQIGRAGGTVTVSVPGTARELRAGRPDLPWRGEPVELPEGTRVRAVEVLSLETTPIAGEGRLASALRPTPGLASVERTDPDPAFFSHRGFLPDPVAELGMQGFKRGANIAMIGVSPVRWDPSTGRLEAVTRLRLRLLLEPSNERPVVRERVVPEWEEGRAVTRAAAVPLGARAGAGGQAAGRRMAERFQATQVPSLLGSPVEYVIITNEEMEPEFQRLADWKTESGTPAVVRTLSFIRQEYPGGSDDGERIRYFIRDAYARWGTKWVLLGGDTEVIPARHGFTAWYGGTLIATDLYYQCVDGNWNADGDHLFGEGFYSEVNPGDGTDFMPDVYVGRAPCITAAQAELFVNKTLTYEKTPVTDYMTNVLLFAEVLFPQDWEYPEETQLDGATYAELVMPYLQANPALHVVRLYENNTVPEWIPGALLETRQAVVDSLSRGYNLSLHIGHGYRNVMHVGDGALSNPDAFGLTNGDRLTNLYAINCDSNAIDFPSIGEAFLLSPTGGAVTNIGSTRADFPSAGQAYEDEYFRLVYQDSVTAVGQAHAEAKLPFVGYAVYDGVNRWTQMTLLMLGDPELRIFTGTPRTLSVTHAPAMTASDTTFDVHVEIGGVPLYGARVVAYKPGTDYQVGTTDGAGDITLPFRPDSVGSFTLTVTGYDCIPYQETVPLSPPAPPVLSAGLPAIDDDANDGTSGNGNGILDAGETADLTIVLKNNGGSPAPTVSGTLTTTDPQVSITGPATSYGTLGVSGTASPSPAFRIVVLPGTEDQREVPFELVLLDGNGGSYRSRFQLVVRGPGLRHSSHSIVDQNGNADGRPDPGETVTYYLKLRNEGTGGARNVTAKLRNFDGLATVLDSVSSWGDIAPDQEKQGDALVFEPVSVDAVLWLEISDENGVAGLETIDLTFPTVPSGVAGNGRASSIELLWTRNEESDLLGYNCYRSTSPTGPFTKVNAVPTDRIAAFTDLGLAPLTRYYFKVAAVDSSGNESGQSAVTSVSTNPPLHTVFPIALGRETPAPVAVAHVYKDKPVAIATGADVLYVVHPDGQWPVDADDTGTTPADFTRRGEYYAAGPTIADLDGGDPEIIGLSWGTQPDPSQPGDSMMVVVFDKDGQMKPGWPRPTDHSMWSPAAAGDVDGDGMKEIIFGSNGNKIYAFHHDGTELLDGDADSSTVGVFKLVNSGFNFSSPAIADLDGDQVNDIICGSFDGNLYAWRGDGTSLPGFPVYLTGAITSSPAVGYLDGPGDTQLEIVVGSDIDSLHVIEADGSRRPGFPKWIRFSGSSKGPSPALADMSNPPDGKLDIVVTGTNGFVYVIDRNGLGVPPWLNIRFSTLSFGATQSSPVVADINGDGRPDIVIGDENSTLAAISGATATMLPGFPIQLNGEVRGAPALCDCDGDGMSEIVVAGWDRNLYVWDYDFPFSPGKTPPWPQFHHDAARTGFASSPVFVGVNDPPVAAAPPLTLELSAPAPNPARAAARFTWSVPASSAGAPYEIAAYDVSGRRVRMLDRGKATPGIFSASWDLRSGDGRPVGEGLYFLRVTLGSHVQSRKVAVVR